ncbi:hypothetical protein KIW84_054604 [Lathyrus oleraceus]|uniref:SAM domain-containing protein n=1 Tax=Pisum sativum TaxID=3888 RepID=A0A9D4WVS5_PEA|nr:hypothetical protein KIW84_054604 [Pisum sativum]
MTYSFRLLLDAFNLASVTSSFVLDPRPKDTARAHKFTVKMKLRFAPRPNVVAITIPSSRKWGSIWFYESSKSVGNSVTAWEFVIRLVDTVEEWLSRYAPMFEIYEVDGELLPMLTLEDLKDMGISVVGSRSKMYTAIQKLRKGFP